MVMARLPRIVIPNQPLHIIDRGNNRQYIEMNPLKAGMVKELADYEWSSYRHNSLGQADA